MKVLFLDFDGVMNNVRYPSVKIMPNCIEILKGIVKETNAKIVVISSRKNEDVGKINWEDTSFYQDFVVPLKNMGIEIYDCVPFLHGNKFQEKELFKKKNWK